MQGREKDAVVISLVRSNEQVRLLALSMQTTLTARHAQREVGFLKEKRRLNGMYDFSACLLHTNFLQVAMTRAKRSLCVVGDSETLRHGTPFLKKWMAWLEAHADVRYAGPE